MGEPEKLIPKHGGYRRLKSFQIAELIFDVTVRFCDQYIDSGSEDWCSGSERIHAGRR